jgi:hypothetical protein
MRCTHSIERLLQAGKRAPDLAGEPKTKQPRQERKLGGAAFTMEHETRFELATLTLATCCFCRIH